MNEEQLKELLYQGLETEIGGQAVYKAAIECAVNPELKEEWKKYLEETQNHEKILLDTFARLGLDPKKETPGRQVVRLKGDALVSSMKLAKAAGKPEAAQLVAAEAVVDAETKDHANWELVGKAVAETTGETKKALKEAFDQVEEQEDEHLYHTMGWARELWIESLGMKAVLPPPEEKKKVTTAIGAARAAQGRDRMTTRQRKPATSSKSSAKR
jgi:hypothetical protein